MNSFGNYAAKKLFDSNKFDYKFKIFKFVNQDEDYVKELKNNKYGFYNYLANFILNHILNKMKKKKII